MLNCTDGGFHLFFLVLKKKIVVQVESNEEIQMCLQENNMKPSGFNEQEALKYVFERIFIEKMCPSQTGELK